MNLNNFKNHCLVITGPTACGKSKLAIDLVEYFEAENIGCEIVNADAFSLYRKMNIGTAKPSPEEQSLGKYHQIDEIDPDQEASVAVYRKKGREDIAQIHERGNIALICGGSGLYIRSLIDDFEFPPYDLKIREKYYARGLENPKDIYIELSVKDPAAAESILPSNIRRIARALEVIEITNQPFSVHLPNEKYFFENTLQIGIDLPLEEIDQLIAQRVAKMRQNGLFEEVKRLESKLGKTAIKAIGYKEIIDMEKNSDSLDEAFEKINIHTRQLVRKQLAFFRRDSRINWEKTVPTPAYIAGKYFPKMVK